MTAKFYLENGRLIPGERPAAPAASIAQQPKPPVPSPPSLVGPRTLRIVQATHELSNAGNPMVVIIAQVVSKDWANKFRLTGYFPYTASKTAQERLRLLSSMARSSFDEAADRETLDDFLKRLLDLVFEAEVIPHSYEGRNGVVNTFKWADESWNKKTLAQWQKARDQAHARRQEKRARELEQARLADLAALMDVFIQMVQEIVRVWASDVVTPMMVRFAFLEL